MTAGAMLLVECPQYDDPANRITQCHYCHPEQQYEGVGPLASIREPASIRSYTVIYLVCFCCTECFLCVTVG